MELIEVNMQLKEDIAVLEKAYVELIEEYKSIRWIPSSMHSSLELIELMCKEQAKVQRGEDSCQSKIDSVERFADYIGLMVGIHIKHLEEKYGVR